MPLLFKKGSKHWKSKLVEDDIVLIRALADEGLTRAEIAEKFEVSPQTVSKIVNRQIWSHVQ